MGHWHTPGHRRRSKKWTQPSSRKRGVVLAIDTDIIVRYLTRDDPAQAEKAAAVINSNDVFVCTTVMLEAEWVLRSAYGFEPSRIATALTAFAGLEYVNLEDPTRTAEALKRMTRGMDFADALHLAAADGCTAFVSFDRRLIRRARDLVEIEIREP
jgi:predicted nucleic-acid-binding protein